MATGTDLQAEIDKYTVALAADPRSRAFAPLAEAYRKQENRFQSRSKMGPIGTLKIRRCKILARVTLGRPRYVPPWLKATKVGADKDRAMTTAYPAAAISVMTTTRPWSQLTQIFRHIAELL